MRRFVLLTVLVVAAVAAAACDTPSAAPPEAGAMAAASSGGSPGALTPAIEGVLTSIRAADAGQLAVSEEDGRFLRTLAASTGATSILEIGAASGYSGIWLGLGARETGGRVVAIEYDATRAKTAIANIRRAGLDDVVTVIEGDAFAVIPTLPGTFDLVFLDAWKPDYQRFFDLVFPRLDPGGLFLAHNVVNKPEGMEDFLATVRTHPGLYTTIVSPSGEGMSVSYKVR